MSLRRLIDRTLGRAPVLQALQPSTFAAEPDRTGLNVPSLMARPATENAPAVPRRASEEPHSVDVDRAAAAAIPPRLHTAPAEPFGANLRTSRLTETIETRLRRVEEIRREAVVERAHLADDGARPEPRSAPPMRPVLDSRAIDQRESRRELRERAAPERTVLASATRVEEAARPRTPPRPAPVAPPSLIAEPSLRRATAVDATAVEHAPTVQVTIGRIEVRAVAPAATTRPAAKRAAPRVSLDDYLQNRERTR